MPSIKNTRMAVAIIVIMGVGIMVAYLLRNERKAAPSPRIRSIGTFLCEQSIAGQAGTLKNSTRAPDLVRIGESLPEVLDAMRDEMKSGYSIENQTGDAFGEGGDVTDTLIIRAERTRLIVRMRYDRTLDRFHIVGYSTRKME